MQGCIITMLPAEYKVALVRLKLKFWYQHVEYNKFYCCHMVNEHLEGSGKPILSCQLWADHVNYTVKKALKALHFIMRILRKGEFFFFFL